MKTIVMSMSEKTLTQQCEVASNIEVVMKEVGDGLVQTIAVPTTEWGLDLVRTLISMEVLPSKVILYGGDLKMRLVQFFELKQAYQFLEKEGTISTIDKTLDELIQELKCK
jgi:hypothetical protein